MQMGKKKNVISVCLKKKKTSAKKEEDINQEMFLC